VGRVDFHQKGHDCAVRLAVRLRDAGVRAHWAVIGDGPDLGRLERLVQQAGLLPDFHFIGWRLDLPDLLRALDVLAMPSRFEGLPLTAVEAMGAHIPVVAFAVDGLAELLTPPFAVEPNDEAAFAEVLAQVISDPGCWPAKDRASLAARLCDPAAVATRVMSALHLQASQA
jgi:glycosyltransferase involved in cell wall biosynthesis